VDGKVSTPIGMHGKVRHCPADADVDLILPSTRDVTAIKTRLNQLTVIRDAQYHIERSGECLQS
jgi:hypothetical protein